MTKTTPLSKSIVIIPILIVAVLAILPKTTAFQTNGEALSIGILLDLLITIPVIYYFLIRNTKIPKFSTVYVLLLGLLVGGFIIPTEHQSLLNTVKMVGIPLLELGLFSFLIFRVWSLNKSYKEKQNNENDFHDNVLIACKETFPGRIGKLLATEISVFYYLFSTKKNEVIKENEFTYFKKSGIKTVVGVFLFLVMIETFVVHILVAKWSWKVAWVLTFLGIYTIIQIVAILRSMNKRMISIDYDKEMLNLRYGFACQTSIPFENIERIERSRKSLSDEKGSVCLSVFDMIDTHNVVIHLKEEQVLHKIYGIEKEYESIAVFLDEKDLFVDRVEEVTKEL